MRDRSSRRESTARWRPGLWILLPALVGGPASGRETVTSPAMEDAVPEPETETRTSQPTAAELQQRIQGMEGKLRESALARKSADQARMEAERRLAESMQALEVLHAAQVEMEQRLSACESARTQLAETLQQQSTADRTLYQVRPGDTLAAISRRFHGRADRWRAIFEANCYLLDDPDRLTPGMMLVIP